MKFNKLLIPLFILPTTFVPLTSCTSNNSSHITYLGNKTLNIVHQQKLDLEFRLDQALENKDIKSIELTSSIEGFFKTSYDVNGTLLTLHVYQISRLDQYDVGVNVDITINTNNWSESFKGFTFKYNLENDKYTRLTAFEDSSIVLNNDNVDIRYCFDQDLPDQCWKSLSTEPLSIPKNKSIYLKGNNPNGLNGTSIKILNANDESKPSIDLYGNLLSLIDEGNNTSIKEQLPDKCFSHLLFNSKGLRYVSGHLLPSTILSPYCYCYLFGSCTNLLNAPQLPSNTLFERCYSNMFSYCTSLSSTPNLPATIMAKECYYSMFIGCDSLVKAPDLPANQLAEKCYCLMFDECRNLKIPPTLPSKQLPYRCYTSMFKFCINLKIKEVETNEENIFFTCPEFSEEDYPVGGMFDSTGGSYCDDPVAGKSYAWYE